MLDWLACFAFNWFQRDLCLQLNIRCRRNSANTLSVEFAAKSFFPISPKYIRRRMYFGDLHRRGFPTVRFDGAAIKSTAVNQTLTETKRLHTRPKYPKRCKEKCQKNLFRLSFQPDLANCGRLTKEWLYTMKAAIFNYAKCFFLEYRARNASRAFKPLLGIKRLIWKVRKGEIRQENNTSVMAYSHWSWHLQLSEKEWLSHSPV